MPMGQTGTAAVGVQFNYLFCTLFFLDTLHTVDNKAHKTLWSHVFSTCHKRVPLMCPIMSQCTLAFSLFEHLQVHAE